MVRKKAAAKTLSEQLREAIQASGISGYALAQATGISTGVLSRFINRERDIRMETADKIAKHLEVSLSVPYEIAARQVKNLKSR